MMQKRCFLVMIYLSWAIYAGGTAYFAWRGQWPFALAWLLGVPFIQWLYIVRFPALSPLMGYGKIADEASETAPRASVQVTLYTALGCPFCPLIEQRLIDLQKKIGFELRKIDVTLRPDLLASKGIRSVPVVEAGNRLLTGLVTTRELAQAIAEVGVPSAVSR